MLWVTGIRLASGADKNVVDRRRDARSWSTGLILFSRQIGVHNRRHSIAV